MNLNVRGDGCGVDSDENDIDIRSWNKMKYAIEQVAFREGALNGKDLSFQKGFDSGYMMGFDAGFGFGRLKGILSILSKMESEVSEFSTVHPCLGVSSNAACHTCSLGSSSCSEISFSELKVLQKQASDSALNNVRKDYSAVLKEHGIV